MSLKDSPQYYHEVLKRIPPRAQPSFEDDAMQARVWDRRWGVYSDVGPLKMVLVHRPGDEMRVMSNDKYDPAIEALIDDEQAVVLPARQGPRHRQDARRARPDGGGAQECRRGGRLRGGRAYGPQGHVHA